MDWEFGTMIYSYTKGCRRGPSRWQRIKMWRSPSSSQIHQKYIYMWNNSYRTPTERWQKTSDFSKGKKRPTYLGRAKEKRKNRDKRIGWDLYLGERAVKEEKFPHPGKPLQWGRQEGGHGGSFGATEESAATGVWRAKRKFPHRRSVPTSIHLPKRLVCSPAGVGGGWELRLGLQRSDPRERAGVGCVNTV